MEIIRPVDHNDLPSFLKLASKVGSGVTTLLDDKDYLASRIERSIATFQDPKSCDDPLYLFLLEDLETKQAIGTCSITPRTLGVMSGYYYLIDKLLLQTKGSKKREIQILRPYRYPHYATELGGLYLLPKCRSRGMGKFLALSRFLYIALEPERFDDELFAELRGFVTEKDESPFWEGVGRFFLDMSYKELQKKMALNEREAVYAMAPYPIFIPLLPKDVQTSVGRPHRNTEAARSMLESWGFNFSGVVDITDGGPRFGTKKEEAYGIKCSNCAQVKIVPHVEGNKTLMIGPVEGAFKATLVPRVIDKNGLLLISKQVAEVLNLTSGDPVMTLSLHIEKE